MQRTQKSCQNVSECCLLTLLSGLENRVRMCESCVLTLLSGLDNRVRMCESCLLTLLSGLENRVRMCECCLLTVLSHQRVEARYCERLAQRFARLHSIPPLKCCDRTTGQIMTTSFHTLRIIQSLNAYHSTR
jgi:hypothetical protein